MTINQFNTFTTLEPGIITDVDPRRMVVLVKGLRNLGPRVELTWLDYNNPGEFGANDSHWGGRIPEKGCQVLVLAEWRAGAINTFVRGYVMGYIPMAGAKFTEEGFSNHRDIQHEPLLEGDSVMNTSSKSMYKVSSSGTVTEECTPRNYRKRSPEENVTYDISENSHQHVSGFTHHVTYSDSLGKATKSVRAIWRRLPKTEYRSESERKEALEDKDNTIVLEEMGKHIEPDYVHADQALASFNPGTIVYKLSVITNGKPVYSKTIDVNGNVYEATASNYNMLVSNTFWTAARFLRYSFGEVIGTFIGIGSGICDFIANRFDFR